MTAFRVPGSTAAALAIAVGLSAGAGSAQDAPPATAPSAITLSAALAETLRNDPAVARAAAAVDERRAALQQARGAFDQTLFFDSSFSYSVTELLGGSRKAEEDRRLRLEIPPEVLDQAANELFTRRPTDGSLLFSDCATASTFVTVVDDAGAPTTLCFDSQDQLVGILGTGIDLEQVQLLDIAQLNLFQNLNNISPAIDAVVQAYLETVTDLMRVIARQLRLAAASLREQRVRIGELPKEISKLDLELTLGYQWRYRNGISLTPSLALDSHEVNFPGKSLSPAVGDSFAPNTFNATLGAVLDIPLGRGRGRTSVMAAEWAAEKNLEAGQQVLVQTASDRLLVTLAAYWDLAAAQERAALLGESVQREEASLEATRALVEGDEIPAVDVKRNEARLADARASVAGARQAVSAARLALQKAMGLAAGSIETAPVAAESLDALLNANPTAAAGGVEGLISQALAARHDLQAAARVREAYEALAAAARTDLRPDLDLSLNVSYNAFHETFRDRFYDFQGFSRAVDGKIAGPSYGMSLRFGIPVGNNEAHGRLIQAESGLTSARINEADLERLVRIRVRDAATALELAPAEIAARQQALEQAEASYGSTLELFKAAEVNVLKTLITEQQVTSARLALVQAKRNYLAQLGRLRAEAGLLVATDEEGRLSALPLQ
jgi:outer membrane protein TolC